MHIARRYSSSVITEGKTNEFNEIDDLPKAKRRTTLQMVQGSSNSSNNNNNYSSNNERGGQSSGGHSQRSSFSTFNILNSFTPLVSPYYLSAKSIGSTYCTESSFLDSAVTPGDYVVWGQKLKNILDDHFVDYKIEDLPQ
eukprot:Awhi_evm1s15329